MSQNWLSFQDHINRVLKLVTASDDCLLSIHTIILNDLIDQAKPFDFELFRLKEFSINFALAVGSNCFCFSFHFSHWRSSAMLDCVYAIGMQQTTHFSMQYHLFSARFLPSTELTVCVFECETHRLDDCVSIPPSILIFRCHLKCAAECVLVIVVVALSRFAVCSILPPFGLRQNIFTFIWMNIIHLFLCYILFLGKYLFGARASCLSIGVLSEILLLTNSLTYKHQ